MRLIDADATLDLLKTLGNRDYRRSNGSIVEAEKMLMHEEYTPTIEAEPVRHGQWDRIDRYSITITGRYVNVEQKRCSKCGKWNGIHLLGMEAKFCENCGAKMDEVNE